MGSKEAYAKFCEKVYVPVFSKPWWMDAVCGEENWDVWLYQSGTETVAAMPYYYCVRDEYRIITKALLTQTNGLIICYPPNQSMAKRQKYEEKIIAEAIKGLGSLNIDLYEQQFHYSFRNFLPFFWERFSIIPRITFVIEDTSSMDMVWNNISSSYKNTIRKGRRFISKYAEIDVHCFFREHEKIFLRQGLSCPFSEELWNRLYRATESNNAGKIFTAQDNEGNVLSLAFIVWDEESAYLLLGGAVPEYSSLQTYAALVYHCIEFASKKGLKFDFEGSVIRRINHSFREYGGTPKEYYRIRKVYNPKIILDEAQSQIEFLKRK